jgi:hypothetical protein
VQHKAAIGKETKEQANSRRDDEGHLADDLDDDCDEAASGIDWRFTAADARIKLKHLYPLVK